MKILVVTPWFPNHPNDQHGNFILDSVEGLIGCNHEVGVIPTRPRLSRLLASRSRPDAAEIGPEIRKRGFKIICQRFFSIPRHHLRVISNRLYVNACFKTVHRFALENAVDIIHAHTELAGTLCCAVGKSLDLPVVTTVHGMDRHHRYLRGLAQRTFLRVALSSPERLVLVGRPLMDFVRNYITSTHHVRIVHNGFREQAAESCKARSVLQSTSKIQLISVSNLVEGKGIDMNLAVLARPELIARRNWHYHIVGGGSMRDALRAQAQSAGIVDRVTFHGQCSTDVVFRLLASADVFMLPSAPEAFGIAYIEAMACGLLTIGAVGQGPATFIRDGYTGFLVDPHEASSLAARLIDILESGSKYAALAEAGRKHVWQHYTWQAHGRNLTEVLLEAREAKKSALVCN